MGRIAWSLVLALVAVPAASASETEPASEAVAEVEPTVVADVPADADLQLQEVQLQERSVSDDATAAQFAGQGSFWWMVGVIVVAGIVLAVLI